MLHRHPSKMAHLLDRLLSADRRDRCRRLTEMIVVPMGSFTMGSPANEMHRFSDEGPQHKVTIAKPFAVGRFICTKPS
jgi:formylglycine-generating enzyme required for sulfatase activity